MIKERIDIVLPNRIGDLILTLPAILCLKQLEAKYSSVREIRLFTHLPMAEIINALNLFKALRFDFTAKAKSWLDPSEKAYFLSTTGKNIGFRGKKTFGSILPEKKYLRYSVNLSYLSFPNPTSVLPGELAALLRDGFQLADISIKHFGLCLELGYTVGQIRETFQFDSSSLSFDNDFFDWKPPISSDYLVFCMEAASGRKKYNSDRRWKEEYFFDLAERSHREYGFQIAFMGISNQPELPDRPYFLDFRQKLNLKQSALLLHLSCGYVGNDTGPLHLANLMKKNSIGMYFREVAVTKYRPIFPQYNTVFYMPQNPEEIYPALEELSLSAVGRS